MSEEKPNSRQEKKCLIIHAGGNKAGSTAIQNMLDNNSHLLGQHGIDYMRSSRVAYAARNQSGNGQALVSHIVKGAGNFEIKSVIKDYVGSSRTSILSSEFFCGLDGQQLKLFFDCLKDMTLSSKIVLYVREPVEYFKSSYSQALRMGFSFSFRSYLETEGNWQHSEFLRAASSVWAPEDIHVLSFDREQNVLFASFWNKIFEISGCDLRNIIEEDRFLTNRSFYHEEINLLRNINQFFTKEFPYSISEWLICDSNYNGTQWQVTEEDIDFIYTRHQGDADWINKVFFGGQDVLRRSKGQLPNAGRTVEADALPDSDTLMRLLFYALRNAPHVAERGLSKFMGNLIDLTDRYGGTARMTDGTEFDNYYYLIKNPDVVYANVNPLDHFEKFGRAEGRNWKPCDCENCNSRR